MRSIIKRNQLLTLAALFLVCLLFVMSGCSKKKKQAPESLPGQEWLDDMRARVEKSITDPSKKSELMGLIEQEESALRGLYEEAGNFFTGLMATDRNYDSTPEDFRNLFAEYNAMRKRFWDESIKIRFKMQSLVTAKEWEKIADLSKRKGLFKQLIQRPVR